MLVFVAELIQSSFVFKEEIVTFMLGGGISIPARVIVNIDFIQRRHEIYPSFLISIILNLREKCFVPHFRHRVGFKKLWNNK